MRTRSQGKKTTMLADAVQNIHSRSRQSGSRLSVVQNSDAQGSAIAPQDFLIILTVFFSSPHSNESLCQPLKVPRRLLDEFLGGSRTAFVAALQDFYEVTLLINHTFQFLMVS
jgi:hypothetical protein